MVKSVTLGFECKSNFHSCEDTLDPLNIGSSLYKGCAAGSSVEAESDEDDTHNSPESFNCIKGFCAN